MANATIFSLTAAATAGLAAYVLAIGGAVDGRWRPVVEDVQITQIENAGPYSTRIWGTFVKPRDCNPIAVEWRKGDQRNYSVIPSAFEEGPKVRIGGDDDLEHFGPWLVNTPASQFGQDVYAVVFHRCNRLWITETHFYP